MNNHTCERCGMYLSIGSFDGHCRTCTTKRVGDLHRYFLISGIVGLILALLSFGILTFLAGDGEPLNTNIILFGIFTPGILSLDYIADFFSRITLPQKLLTGLVFFLLPFSRYVKLTPDYRDSEALEAPAEWLVTLLSSPYWIIRNTILYIRLRRHLG